MSRPYVTEVGWTVRWRWRLRTARNVQSLLTMKLIGMVMTIVNSWPQYSREWIPASSCHRCFGQTGGEVGAGEVTLVKVPAAAATDPTSRNGQNSCQNGALCPLPNVQCRLSRKL